MAKWEEAPEIDSEQKGLSSVPKWQQAPEVSEEQPVKGPSSSLKSTGEVLASLGTGAIAQPIAGIAGLGALAIPGVNAADVVRKVQNSLTYSPKTEGAKKALGVISYPFEKLAQGTEFLGGLAGGELGATLGRIGGEAAPMLIPGGELTAPLRKVSPELAALRARALAAREAGYKIPPVMAGDESTAANIAQSVAGKIKTQQEASIANQEITNSLVKKDLGIPEDISITPELLSNLRKQAGKSYEDIKTLPGQFTADTDYIAGVHSLGRDAMRLSEEFPDLASHKEIRNLIDSLSRKDMSPQNAVNLVRKLRFDAKANYKNMENPAKLELAKAQDNAAKLVEDLIDKNLQSRGVPELLDNFRNSRIQIAKIHNVDKVLNESTGTVPARKLGAMLDKGVPLSGGMKKAAEFARSFEKAAQTPEMIGGVSYGSPWDIGLSTLGGIAGGLTMGPYGSLGAMLPAIRPIARKAILSDLVQKGVPKQVKGPISTFGESLPYLISPLPERGE